MTYVSGEELALKAMKKELTVLINRAKRAKAKADERVNIVYEYIAINKEFVEIVDSDANGASNASVVRRLNDLKRRRKRADRIIKKDACKLIEKQSEAESHVRALQDEISIKQFSINSRKGESC
jgi:hypothetical protein